MRGQGERAEEGVEGGGAGFDLAAPCTSPPPAGASTRKLSLVVAHKSYSFGPV